MSSPSEIWTVVSLLGLILPIYELEKRKNKEKYTQYRSALLCVMFISIITHSCRLSKSMCLGFDSFYLSKLDAFIVFHVLIEFSSRWFRLTSDIEHIIKLPLILISLYLIMTQYDINVIFIGISIGIFILSAMVSQIIRENKRGKGYNVDSINPWKNINLTDNLFGLLFLFLSGIFFYISQTEDSNFYHGNWHFTASIGFYFLIKDIPLENET
jgi:hypothetical protein